MISSKELRDAWRKFYIERDHVDAGTVPLVSDGSTGVLFNVAGMQPLMPYLLGKEHPQGKRLYNIQGCVRTNDIESVGDECHVTFFEMMGSWSLGDYFKKERCKWSYELLTQVLGFASDRIATSVFEGNEKAPRDEETARYRVEAGFKKENVYFLPEEDNWWGLDYGPCGPDSEMFYINDVEPCGPNCRPGCSCGKYVEVGNDVFMQYNKTEDGTIVPLEKKNVDTGWGLERILACVSGVSDVYRVDVFWPVIDYISNSSGVAYGKDYNTTKAMRVIADHIRTSVMLIGDSAKLQPSNVGAGYILRRLIRRAVRYARFLNLGVEHIKEIANIYIYDIYAEAYPGLLDSADFIIKELTVECGKFAETIERGLKEFNKIISKLENCDEGKSEIEGFTAFRLYDTFGFPLELTIEMASEKGLTVDEEGFAIAFKEHQDKSRTTEKNALKGGLVSESEMGIKHHTATHLLNAALKKLLGADTHQRGSKVSDDKLRFDFNCERKLEASELVEIENTINGWIAQGCEVLCESMDKYDAVELGAEHEFLDHYPDVVKVYTIGDISKEICNGPHVNNISELGHFKILKEKSSSRGVRRIEACVD